MSSEQDFLALAAVQLASQVPAPTLELAASAIETCASDGEAKKRSVAQAIPHPYYRDLITSFLDEWQDRARNVSPGAVALALRVAAHAERAHRDTGSVELVWTGPEADGVPFRRTEQAVLQVLDTAQERITLVSYAVYRIPRVRAALVKAAGRGVRVRAVVERGDTAGGKIEYDTLHGLGPDVAACSMVYYWPEEKRERHGERTGSLHAKCAVSDGRCLLISSANLTEHAFTLNMELGVLVTRGNLPRQVEQHFDRLIAIGVLRQVGAAGLLRD